MSAPRPATERPAHAAARAAEGTPSRALRQGAYYAQAGLAALRNALEPPGICLGYHRIGSDPLDTERLCVSRAHFEEQVRFLADHVDVVPLESLADGRGNRVAITFDDGYRDNVDVAADILAKHGLPATFFVTAGFITGLIEPWWEALKHELANLDALAAGLASPVARATGPDAAATRCLPISPLLLPGHEFPGHPAILSEHGNRPDAARAARRVVGPLRRSLRSGWSVEACDGITASRWCPAPADPSTAPGKPAVFMNEADLRSLARSSLFRVGSHTVTHRMLSALSEAEQFAELSASRRILERLSGQSVDLLAYPYGQLDCHDARTRRIAATCGYRLAMANHAGQVYRTTDRFALPRHVVPDVGHAAFARWLPGTRLRRTPPVRRWLAPFRFAAA